MDEKIAYEKALEDAVKTFPKTRIVSFIEKGEYGTPIMGIGEKKPGKEIELIRAVTGDEAVDIWRRINGEPPIINDSYELRVGCSYVCDTMRNDPKHHCDECDLITIEDNKTLNTEVIYPKEFCEDVKKEVQLRLEYITRS